MKTIANLGLTSLVLIILFFSCKKFDPATSENLADQQTTTDSTAVSSSAAVEKKDGKQKFIRTADIKFKVKDDFLYFMISNPTPEITQHQDNFNKSSGIGIENVKKRLELGYNKNDYKLSFKNKKNIFVVKLVIKVT